VAVAVAAAIDDNFVVDSDGSGVGSCDDDDDFSNFA
jgi:hypothetical protein